MATATVGTCNEDRKRKRELVGEGEGERTTEDEVRGTARNSCQTGVQIIWVKWTGLSVY